MFGRGARAIKTVDCHQYSIPIPAGPRRIFMPSLTCVPSGQFCRHSSPSTSTTIAGTIANTPLFEASVHVDCMEHGHIGLPSPPKRNA